MALKVESHELGDLYNTRIKNNAENIQPDSASCFSPATNPLNIDTVELSTSSKDDSLSTSSVALGVGTTLLAIGSLALALKFKKKLPFSKVTAEGYTYRRGLSGKKLFLKPTSFSEYKKIEIPNNSAISQRVKNPHPTNLYSELKRCDYSNSEVRTLLQTNPELSGFVGSLPNSWAKRLKSADVTKKIDEALSKYSTEFHAVKEGELPSTTKLQQELSEIMGTNVEIKNLGSGAIGNAYTIKAFNEKFVYKVFYNEPLFNITNTSRHGNHAELLSAIKASRDNSKDFAQFYMGNFGKYNDGYLLTKYIPKEESAESLEKLSSHKFNFKDMMKKYGTSDYKADNVRNGIILDYGEVNRNSYNNLSPKAQKIARELFPVLDGKSPEKVAKIAEKYTSTQEFSEVKNYLNSIIENQYCFDPKHFAAKKEHLAKLGLDYKPKLNKLLSSNCKLEPFSADYGLTPQEIKQLRHTFKQNKAKQVC